MLSIIRQFQNMPHQHDMQTAQWFNSVNRGSKLGLHHTKGLWQGILCSKLQPITSFCEVFPNLNTSVTLNENLITCGCVIANINEQGRSMWCWWHVRTFQVKEEAQTWMYLQPSLQGSDRSLHLVPPHWHTSPFPYHLSTYYLTHFGPKTEGAFIWNVSTTCKTAWCHNPECTYVHQIVGIKGLTLACKLPDSNLSNFCKHFTNIRELLGWNMINLINKCIPTIHYSSNHKFTWTSGPILITLWRLLNDQFKLARGASPVMLWTGTAADSGFRPPIKTDQLKSLQSIRKTDSQLKSDLGFVSKG